MKNYAVFNKDLSQLIAEFNSYIDGISSPAYRAVFYHKTGPTEDLVGEVPSLGTAFTDEGLTAIGISHRVIDNVVRAVAAPCPLLLIPLKNTANSTFSVVEPIEGATTLKDYLTNHDFYVGADCNVLESVTITGPILINTGVIYAIENSDYTLSEFAMVAFNEDVSSYFAE